MGLCLFFLPNFPGAKFIQGGTFIPDSRVAICDLKDSGFLKFKTKFLGLVRKPSSLKINESQSIYNFFCQNVMQNFQLLQPMKKIFALESETHNGDKI